VKPFLILLQPVLNPALICLLLWATWQTFVKRDGAVGLALYIALIVIVDAYMNTALYLPGFDKGSIRFSEVCAIFLLTLPTAGSPAWSFRRPVTWLVGFYFLMLFASALRTTPLLDSFMEFRRIILPQVVAFIIAKRHLASVESLKRFHRALTTVVLVIALFTFWDLFLDRVFLKSDMLGTPIYYHNRGQNRFGSFFMNPNFLAGFVVLVFPAMFVWTLNEKTRSRWWYALAGLGALVFSLVESQSRGPLLAFAGIVVLLIFGPVHAMSRGRRLSFAIVLVLAFLVVMPGAFRRAVERFDTIDRETEVSARSRETTWRYALMMIRDNPMAGLGFGEKRFMRGMIDYGYAYEFGFETESLDAPHNSYLQAAVYSGVPAVLCFLAANGILVIAALRKCVRLKNREMASTVFGLAIGIVGFLGCVGTDLQLFAMAVAPVYWVFLGLLVSVVDDAHRVGNDAAESSDTSTVQRSPLVSQLQPFHRAAPVPAGIDRSDLAAPAPFSRGTASSRSR
jgi:O-antigen ligase